LDKEVMNTKQAADWLGLSVSTMNQWRANGLGPTYVRMGGRIAYRIQDLREWVKGAVVDKEKE
jgi:predicted site-specific integrase-resolvase